MKKSVLLILLCCAAPLLADDLLSSAREALDDGFPQIAVLKIEQAFPDIGKPKAGAEANLLYARALIGAGKPEVADELLKRELSRTGSEGLFWLAQAQASCGEWATALKNYTICAGDNGFARQKEASVGQARMLANTNSQEGAVSVLEKAYAWPLSPIRVKALLDLAEIELGAGRIKPATKALDEAQAEAGAEKTRWAYLTAQRDFLAKDDAAVLKGVENISPLNARMAVDLTILRGRSLSRSGNGSKAESLLEDFIAEHPNAPGLERVFLELDKIYARTDSSSTSELKRWAEEKDSGLRTKLAMYYLARFEARQNNPTAAVALLESLAANPTANPLATETSMELAALRVSLGQADEALALLPPAGTSPQTDYLRGIALARKNDYQNAATVFTSASRDESLAEDALYNAALCQLAGGIVPMNAREALAKRFSASPKIELYRLQEAYAAARKGSTNTSASLKKLAESADAKIAGKAALALAEWKYQQLDFTGAVEALNLVNSVAAGGRKEALAVFLADTGDVKNEERVIADARKFLLEYSDSDSEAAVRMKLGELLFRRGDFAAARVELESLARKFHNTPFHSPSLFLAAQSAARIPDATSQADAMLLLEEIASKPSNFAHRARLEQANLLAAQHRPQDANLILDKILSTNPDIQMKATALIEKGKNFFVLGNQDSGNTRAAIDVWKQVASEKSWDPVWRNQALARIGTAYEKIGDPDAAVANYYEVFKPAASAPKEFFWFHKAGFSAGRILEAQKKWNEAIRVYEIMAASEGPRAVEAKNRIQKLRLENFIWDGN
jgi:predicted negative regulator of RcsB-dependent stress response